MEWVTIDVEVYKKFGEALAIGLLIGVERYKDRAPGERKSAGVRTFAIFALLGAVCGLLEQPTSTLVTFVGLLALLSLGYYRESSQHVGLTTEVAAVLTFWLGFLTFGYEKLAISAAIVLALLLASKSAVHDFVRRQISEVELFDTLKFLAVVFVVFPLLPDRELGPYGFFNPTHIWLLVILVSAISYFGYVLMRVLGDERGLEVSSLIGGIVSTTAVTMSLASRARQTPEHSRVCGVAGVMANAVQFPRLLLLVWIVDGSLGAFLTVPLLGMGAVGMLWARVLARARRRAGEVAQAELLLQNPFSLLPALKFGLFFVVVLLLAKTATVLWGEGGIYLASTIAGLGDASAISLSVAKLVGQGSLSVPVASVAILIAAGMNALVKLALAAINGTRHLAFWLGAGFATMLATGAVLLAVRIAL